MAGASDETAEALLSSGGFGSYDATNDDGERALHYFAKLGRMDMLLWLKSKGCADVMNARDDVGGQVVVAAAAAAAIAAAVAVVVVVVVVVAGWRWRWRWRWRLRCCRLTDRRLNHAPTTPPHPTTTHLLSSQF